MRALSLLLALAAACAFMSGCHGSRSLDAFVMPDAFDTSREYEITFWAKNDTNKTQTEIYEKAITDFEALYPNVNVTLRLYTNYGKIYNDVITNISTGTTPNVCITYPDHIATYNTGKNIVVPLDGLIDDARYGLGGSSLLFDSPARGELIGRFLDECAIDSVYYALPFMRSTEACYVNKTYVEALGYTLPDSLTWDFIWEVSESAAKKDADGVFAVNGQKVMIPFIYKSTDNMMIQYLAQAGAGYSDENGNALLFNDTTRGFLFDIASHAKSGAFSTFKLSGYPANFLNAGQCVFAIDSTAGATWMGSHAPLSDISPDKLVEFETAVMAIPQLDPDNPKMISQGPSVCVFNKSNPQEVLASWLFAQYLLTNEVQIAYAQTEGYVPVTAKAHSAPEYVDYLSHIATADGADEALYYDVKLKASKLLLDNIDNTFVTSVYSGSASLRDASGALIESVAKSVRRSQTVDDAYIDRLYADTAALYRLTETAVKSEAASGEAGEQGPLPTASKALIVSLCCAWIIIGAYGVIIAVKNKKLPKNTQ